MSDTPTTTGTVNIGNTLHESGVCPSCGYCPHCGRGAQMQPHYPYQPIWIAPVYPGFNPGWRDSYPWITYTSTCTVQS